MAVRAYAASVLQKKKQKNTVDKLSMHAATEIVSHAPARSVFRQPEACLCKWELISCLSTAFVSRSAGFGA